MSDDRPHPTSALDADVHQWARLGILGLLHEVDEADFNYLLRKLELTDGNLSRNLTYLGDRGYISITKGFEGRRARTWLQLTDKGVAAFRVEIDALREIVRRADKASRKR